MKQTNTSTPKIHWLTSLLAGIVLVATGVAISFFPKMAMSIALIVASILFFAFGVTDSFSALKNKKDENEWKSNLGNGLITLLVGIFIFSTMYVPTIKPMHVITVLCIWAVIRCVLLINGFIKGKTKKKANLLQAVLLCIGGVSIFLFRDLIFASTKLIGYALITIGSLVIIYAFMKKSSSKQKAVVSIDCEKQLIDTNADTNNLTEETSVNKNETIEEALTTSVSFDKTE